MADSYQAPPLPNAFIWRRTHSLMGLWLVLFLMEHLLTNSQAALFLGDDGEGFINGVNFLKGLPYLPVIEIFLLGMPLLIHGAWGIRYLMTVEYNSSPSDGTAPALTKYSRNHAYTWQRITSWILLVGIVAHVIHMRFLEYPSSAKVGTEHSYMVRVNEDEGLHTLSKRLGFEIYHPYQLSELQQKLESQPTIQTFNDTPEEAINTQKHHEGLLWLKAAYQRPLREGQLLLVSPSFGMAELLMVRETFKNPLMILLYTGLVLTACFHAFNGLWTFMITWGCTLTVRSQQIMRKIAVSLMTLITLLGLAAIWGTYWFNLTH